MNIVSITVSTAIMGVLMPGVMTMSIAPTVAQVRSNNFAVAEAQAVTFADAAAIAYELPEVPDICTVNEELTEVTCVEGEGAYKMTAKRSFRLLDAGAVSTLGVYSDNDRDGFDDVTGMMTHYAECYSGWKGQSDNNALKNNCELGGRYVIPAYISLYN
jgi:hypothetical protein